MQRRLSPASGRLGLALSRCIQKMERTNHQDYAGKRAAQEGNDTAANFWVSPAGSSAPADPMAARRWRKTRRGRRLGFLGLVRLSYKRRGARSLQRGSTPCCPSPPSTAGRKAEGGRRKADADRGTPPVSSQKRPRGRRASAVSVGWG